jgi:hypothetical protein
MVFTAQTTYSTGLGSHPSSLSVIDINSDSKADIIVANYNADSIDGLLNFGDGTFLHQTSCSTATNSHPQFVSVVDVNSDAKLDIIVANSGGTNVGVLLAS